MLDVSTLEKDLVLLIEKKVSLQALDYNSKDYDELEEKLHEQEDAFLEKHGDFLEEALHGVHDEFCPDSEVLLPIAYVPNKVTKSGNTYQADFSEGVFVDADDFESPNTKLVLVPGPVRIELQIGGKEKKVVWQPTVNQ